MNNSGQNNKTNLPYKMQQGNANNNPIQQFPQNQIFINAPLMMQNMQMPFLMNSQTPFMNVPNNNYMMSNKQPQGGTNVPYNVNNMWSQNRFHAPYNMNNQNNNQAMMMNQMNAQMLFQQQRMMAA